VKKVSIVPVMLMCILLVSCGKNYYDDCALPSNPIVFEQATFYNPNNDKDAYVSIEYNGRVYIPYGTLQGAMGQKYAVKECVGYIKNDADKNDTQVRVYVLYNTDDYLMVYITGGIMNQPDFYRAIDTIDKDIETPSYIDKLDDDYWK